MLRQAFSYQFQLTLLKTDTCFWRVSIWLLSLSNTFCSVFNRRLSWTRAIISRSSPIICTRLFNIAGVYLLTKEYSCCWQACRATGMCTVRQRRCFIRQQFWCKVKVQRCYDLVFVIPISSSSGCHTIHCLASCIWLLWHVSIRRSADLVASKQFNCLFYTLLLISEVISLQRSKKFCLQQPFKLMFACALKPVFTCALNSQPSNIEQLWYIFKVRMWFCYMNSEVCTSSALTVFFRVRRVIWQQLLRRAHATNALCTIWSPSIRTGFWTRQK